MLVRVLRSGAVPDGTRSVHVQRSCDRGDRRHSAAAVEYGVLSVLFVILIIGSWTTMGNELGNFFNETANMFINQAN